MADIRKTEENKISTVKEKDTLPTVQENNPLPTVQENNAVATSNANTKFCKHCGEKIAVAAIICPKCGCQVENMAGQQAGTPNIVITNTNTNTNTNTGGGMAMERNKWVSIGLCLFLGWLGAHKFYEGKTFLGVVYLCTCGLCFIGVIADLLSLIGKPNPYYVRI